MLKMGVLPATDFKFSLLFLARIEVWLLPWAQNTNVWLILFYTHQTSKSLFSFKIDHKFEGMILVFMNIKLQSYTPTNALLYTIKY